MLQQSPKKVFGVMPQSGESFGPLIEDVVEKPRFSDEFLLSSSENGQPMLYGIRRPGQIIVEVGKIAAYEVRVRKDLQVAVGGLVRTLTESRFVRDNGAIAVLQEGCQTGLTNEHGEGGFIITTSSPNSLAFYPDFDADEDVLITTIAGHLEPDYKRLL